MLGESKQNFVPVLTACILSASRDSIPPDVLRRTSRANLQLPEPELPVTDAEDDITITPQKREKPLNVQMPIRNKGKKRARVISDIDDSDIEIVEGLGPLKAPSTPIQTVF